MSSSIFNIQNSVNITNAIQSIQTGLVNESRLQHANAVSRQQREVVIRQTQAQKSEEVHATIDLSQNRSSQQSFYTPLPRRGRKQQPADEQNQQQQAEQEQHPVKHIDITI